MLTHVLPDTGAESDLVDEDTAKWLQDNGAQRIECSSSICSGIGHSLCTPCQGQLNFVLTLNSDLDESLFSFSIKAKIAQSGYPVIVGRTSILQNRLTVRCFRYFSGVPTTRALLETVVTAPAVAKNSWHQPVPTIATYPTADRPTLMVAAVREFKQGTLLRKEDLLTPTPDEDYDDPLEGDMNPWEEYERNSTAEAKPQIFGPPELQLKLIALVNEFADVFRQELNAEPARLPPLKLEIDVSKWEQPANRERIHSEPTQDTETNREAYCRGSGTRVPRSKILQPSTTYTESG